MGQSAEPLRLLFVGNSLTYTNDLPGMVETMARSYGYEIVTECLCKPNFAIEDHFPELDHKLAQGWDWIIAQQGPSSLPESRLHLMAGTRELSQRVSGRGQLALLTVWPSLGYYQSFDAVVANYADAAQEVGILNFAAGAFWQHYFLQTENFDLYGPDGFHPSDKGTLMAALAIIHGLWPEQDLADVSGKPYRPWCTRQAFDLLVAIVQGE